MAEIKTKLKDLIPDDANFNKGTEYGNGLIEKSLSKFGAGRSILLDKNNKIIAGNKTVENAASIGLENVRIIETTGDEIIAVKRTDVDLNSKRGREMALADNATAKANIDFDFEVLPVHFDTDEMAEWGVIDFGSMVEDETTDNDAEPQIDRAEELNKVWKVSKGDLWQIGEHRLLCGDSTKRSRVDYLMDGEKAELLFTSPPYADQRDYDGESDLTVKHIVNFISTFAEVCNYQTVNLGLQRKDHEIIEYWQEYISEAKQSGYKLMAWNVWKKNTVQIGQQSAFIPVYHEWIFVFGRQFKDINRTVARKSEITKSKSMTRRQSDGTTKASSIGFQGELKEMESVFISNPELGEIRGLHPATFPIELPSAYIEAMTDKGQIVCEPFAGSGTTLVASQNLNRKCYAIEISENYCAVILERMKTAFPSLEIKRIEQSKTV
jgi:DNA modification methylase